MKSFVLAALVLLGTTSFAAADVTRSTQCGTLSVPYGCDADVCLVELAIHDEVLSITADSVNGLELWDIAKLAETTPQVCVRGYLIEKTFHVESISQAPR